MVGLLYLITYVQVLWVLHNITYMLHIYCVILPVFCIILPVFCIISPVFSIILPVYCIMYVACMLHHVACYFCHITITYILTCVGNALENYIICCPCYCRSVSRRLDYLDFTFSVHWISFTRTCLQTRQYLYTNTSRSAWMQC